MLGMSGDTKFGKPCKNDTEDRLNEFFNILDVQIQDDRIIFLMDINEMRINGRMYMNMEVD